MKEKGAQSFTMCYFAVETMPFYLADESEFDPGQDARRNHNCANPIKVIEMKHDPEAKVSMMPNEGTPRMISTVDLNGFTAEEPTVCATCPLFEENIEYKIRQTQLRGATVSELQELLREQRVQRERILRETSASE